MWEMTDRSSSPPATRRAGGYSSNSDDSPSQKAATSEDLHAWSIYRQNLNSDFTDSALGSSEKSPLPFGDFQLQQTTVQSILSNPKYGHRSELGSNAFTYLKFGLPRIPQPAIRHLDKVLGGNSSGYESTDDEDERARSVPLRSSRSEDVLIGTPRERHQRHMIPNNNFTNRHMHRTRGGRAASETNLVSLMSMSQDASTSHRARRQNQLSNETDGSMAMRNMRGYDEARNSVKDYQRHFNNERLISPGETSAKFFKYPHIQLRNVSVEVKPKHNKPRIYLDNITMEARGGDIVAIMATNRHEGTALCDLIANRSEMNHVTGDILFNGVISTPSSTSSRLKDRVAYANRDNAFSSDMSVLQVMKFHGLLRRPGHQARSQVSATSKINNLIEDLGLSQVKHTRVHDLTISERRRLNIATQLQLETEIVVLDEATKGMDIFDIFFLVEYLRQWAINRGRIILLTLQPPTYEILTMISKVVLISTGRLMYFGKRRQLLPYFALIEYPCPSYKNPSDYYLDLVTLDNLSAEATLESSQRIDTLCKLFKHRMEQLSDPGPPGILPPKIKHANYVLQIISILIRAMFYTYPFNLINWLRLILLAGGLSTLLGMAFVGMRWRYWDVRWQTNFVFEQDNIGDRMGFHFVFMNVGIWPILMAIISDTWRDKSAITRDVNDQLYSKSVYFFTHAIYSLPTHGTIFVAYLIPGYLMAGIHFPQTDSKDLELFYVYIGLMLLYLITVRTILLCLAHMYDSRHWTVTLGGFIFTCLSLVSGYAIHQADTAPWLVWLRYVSPQYWMQYPLIQGEFKMVDHFRCSYNPVIREAAIIKQVACGLPDGVSAIRYFGFNNESSVFGSVSNVFKATPVEPMTAVFVTAVFFIVAQFLAGIFFILRTNQKTKRSSNKLNQI